ncbi:hypothetical protein CLIM01_09722 [Colletotrichum limetticola]|uniref:Uncharacterized protein n=1 Tax=Colletotrichum limetticola TaxID=1209924 RepID=A0ABQ9PN47_9PEZI|nr:hypothetical protein CLIM01_09722 [Colletotrichum limetticola]
MFDRIMERSGNGSGTGNDSGILSSLMRSTSIRLDHQQSLHVVSDFVLRIPVEFALNTSIFLAPPPRSSLTPMSWKSTKPVLLTLVDFEASMSLRRGEPLACGSSTQFNAEWLMS